MISYEDYYAFQALVKAEFVKPSKRKTIGLLLELSGRLSNPIEFKEGVFFEQFSELASAAQCFRLAGYDVPKSFLLHSDAHFDYCLFLCELLCTEIQAKSDRYFVTKTLVEVEYQGRCLSQSEYTAIQALVCLLDL